MTREPPTQLSVALRLAFQDQLRALLGLAFSGSRERALEIGVHRTAQRLADGDPELLLERLHRRDRGIMTALIEELTVGETYFFRDPQHFGFLRRFLRGRLRVRAGPRQHPRPGVRPIRLWSAGCASGEEPYTMAIIALESLGEDAAEMVEIIATDVHPGALARAREGLYRVWSFRGVASALRDRWFMAEGTHWRVRDQVRRLVRFAPLNLVDTTSATWPWDVDVVFCRNVLVYLDASVIPRVCAGLARALVPDGWLITAPCDPLLDCPGLRTDTSTGFLAYRAKPAIGLPASLPVPCLPAGDAALPASVHLADDLGVDWAGDLAGDLAVDIPGDPVVNLAEALHLADQGETAAALCTIDALLSAAPTLPAGYLLRATLRQSLGDHQGAVMDIQRALLLDRSLAFAHVLAAASRAALGEARAALRALHNARKALLVLPAEAPVPGAQGITVGELLSVCEQLERVLTRPQPTRRP